MLAFIQAQPHVVERILIQIETPAIVDLLVRIIQLDEYTSGANVLEVCFILSCFLSLLTPFSVAFKGAPNPSAC